MSLTVMSRVGKKRTLVIPKTIAEKIGLNEDCRVKITAEEGRIIIEPLCDAVWLSLYGKKITRVTLEELEHESIEQQEKYINSN